MLDNRLSAYPVAVLVRGAAVGLLWLPLPLLLGVLSVYGAYQAILPPTPNILEPPPGAATRVYTLDGTPVGGLARGAAPWVAYDDVPPRLIEAFLAAEDDQFFLHGGVDLQSIVRAALVNLRRGAVRQGGSTITQQVAKMFVGSARSYERKLIELMMARRLEATYSKEDILECYLNRIYLGAGATGVVAAARIYFDHGLDALTLSEAATLAGLASAPSAFDPYDHPERARQRRDHVLARMAALAFITDDAAAAAQNEPVRLRERGEVPLTPIPWGVDAIRMALAQASGPDVWRRGGLSVQTGLSSFHAVSAQQALWSAVTAIDQRQGYRGPLVRGAGMDDARLDDLVARHFPPDEPVRPARVEAVEPSRVTVHVDGQTADLGPDAWRWAAPYDADSSDNDVQRDTALGLAEPGDIVLVQRQTDGSYRLSQIPRLEGALVGLDVDTDYIVSMVGGLDYDRNQFNRVTAGCRQPGSVFKPVIYSLALDRGYTLVSHLMDAPIQLRLGPLEVWRPRNSDADFRGELTLRDALILSRNLPTVRLFEELGAPAVVQRAGLLGLTTPMDPTDALALGASCIHPIDAVRAFTVFDDGGYRPDPILIVSAVDGAGRLVADAGVFHDGVAGASAALWRAWRDLAEAEGPVIDPRTAYLMRHVLSDVVRLGTGHRAQALGVPAAGKTGTTQAYDAWFVGFTESLATAVWVGSDRNTRALGRGETGAEVALPGWLAYMQAVLAGRAQGSLVDPMPPGVVMVKVDLRTGLLAQEGAPGAWLPFLDGTEPTTYAPTPDEVDLMRLDRVDDGF